MFVDYAKIFVEAGRGGNGCISFRREKYKRRGGPDGGNGGRGGNIIIKTDKFYKTLYDLTLKRYFKAESGKHGSGSNKTGRSGKNLIIKVPIGTYIYDAHTKEVLADLIENNQEVVVAKGGSGGLGNAAFKSSTERAPYFAQKGTDGQKRTLILELKLIAHVGIIGYPNVGKSSLLTRLTNAKPTIADYPFTTKQPVLGVLELEDKAQGGIVLADIPGLIEGAHRGAGLGRLFLRHIERTKLLIHLLDGTQEDIYKNYLALNEELRLYNPILINKPQLIAVNKIDQPRARYNLECLREKLSTEILAISALTAEGLNCLIEKIKEKLLKKYSINK